MANGQLYSGSKITAASLDYPLGSKILIRNLETGKELLVEITDRGPWGTRYKLDLSKAAFLALGFTLRQGWGWVTIRRVS